MYGTTFSDCHDKAHAPCVHATGAESTTITYHHSRYVGCSTDWNGAEHGCEGMRGGIAQPVACQSGAAQGAWSCRNVMRRHLGIVTERERLDVRLPPCQDLVARIGLNSTNPNLAPYESTETCKPHKKVLWSRKKGDFIHWHALGKDRNSTPSHKKGRDFHGLVREWWGRDLL